MPKLPNLVTKIYLYKSIFLLHSLGGSQSQFQTQCLTKISEFSLSENFDLTFSTSLSQISSTQSKQQQHNNHSKHVHISFFWRRLHSARNKGELNYLIEVYPEFLLYHHFLHCNTHRGSLRLKGRLWVLLPRAWFMFTMM